MDVMLVLDCEESKLHEKLTERSKESGRPDDSAEAISARIAHFKKNVLPVIKHYDDKGKIVVVSNYRKISNIDAPNRTT